jgi:hypothetical protein
MSLRRQDRVVLGVALALVLVGLAVQPVAFRVDERLRVADACYPWPVEGAMRVEVFDYRQRVWTFFFRTPSLDPWGRPWAFRPPGATDPGVSVPLGFDPADPAGPLVRGRPTQVVYSFGPDGKDDGGVSGPDVVFEIAALRGVFATDTAGEAGCWLAGLGLLAWAIGRRAARRRRWLLAALPLALGAFVGVMRTVWRFAYSGAIGSELPSLPLVVPPWAAAFFSLLAVLGLVAALGWATTRAQCAGEGEGAAGA